MFSKKNRIKPQRFIFMADPSVYGSIMEKCANCKFIL